MKQTLKPQQGFTLIEILVVVVIIGTLVGLAALAVGGKDQTREQSFAAKRLFQLARLAQEEAVLQGVELGLTINRNEYQFLVYNEPINQWYTYQAKPFKKYSLEEGLRLELEVEGDGFSFNQDEQQSQDKDNESIFGTDTSNNPPPRGAGEATSLVPEILILSSGEMTPFSVYIELANGDGRAFRLKSDGLNELELTQVDR